MLQKECHGARVPLVLAANVKQQKLLLQSGGLGRVGVGLSALSLLRGLVLLGRALRALRGCRRTGLLK